MAQIAPFRGVRYNPDQIADVRSVVAPPYDVISSEQLADLRRRSPYNIVHVDLPNAGGAADENPYTQAGHTFRGWLQDGVMGMDKRPALYAYHQTYRVPGSQETLQLTGFIAAVRLARWDEGVVLPHEHTFAKPKEDRLRLMRAGQANFSQVYSFYSDPDKIGEAALSKVTTSVEPHIQVHDDDGAEHRVWVVDEPGLIRQVVEGLADRTLYIADGHHRYETAIDYRDEMRARVGTQSEAGHEYVMMMLVNADSGGLTVLPTHRMVRLAAQIDRVQLRERLSQHFRVTTFAVSDGSEGAKQATDAINGSPVSMALIWGNEGWVLEPLSQEGIVAAIDDEASNAWKLLGATILHRVVLEQGLGMSRELQGDGEHITYTRDAVEAVQAAVDGSCDVACILNAPSPDEIMEVAHAGDAMPHKSTYFYPKLLTGLVLMDLSIPVGPAS